MQEVILNEEGYIELNKLIKLIGWAESGGEANQLIANGKIKLNGFVETRKRKKIFPNDIITFASKQFVLK